MKKILLFSLLVFLGLSFSGCDKKNNQDVQQYKYNTFVEPSLDWGNTYVNVTSQMQAKGLYISYEENMSTMKYVHYMPSGKEKETMLVFYTDINSYHCAYVYLKTSTVSSDELTGFLGERYNFLGNLQYRTKDNLTDVFVNNVTEDDTEYYIIQYIKAE